VYRWSTDQVDVQDRFDYWREVRAKGLFGITAELELERRQHFSGEFSLRKIDTAGLIELRASPYRAERSAADIANVPGDSLCIYQQLGSGGRFGVRGIDDFTVHPGRFATSYSDLPYSTVPLGAEGFHLRILKLPVANIASPKAGLQDLFPKPFADHPSLAPLLEACFADLTELDGDAETALTAPLVQALAQLALIERGVVRPGSHAALEAFRVARLSLARRLIAHHVTQAEVSPAFVAELLGISIRHLHVLFEATGASFSQTVTAGRVAQSCRLLIEAPARSISQVAFASGFDSLATFYRAFHAAVAMSPGDFRQRAGRT
jgi:AraC-like DNA-binding protein